MQYYVNPIKIILTVAKYTLLKHEFGYIHAQAKHVTNFSDLHAIFVAQTLAMIYALKLRRRSYDNTKSNFTIRIIFFRSVIFVIQRGEITCKNNFWAIGIKIHLM